MNKIPIPPPPKERINIPPPPIKARGEPKNNEFLEIRKERPINIDNTMVPPSAIDMEQAVLGALISFSESAKEVMDILESEVFYKESHKIIFTSIKRLYDNREPIDLLTVSEDLKKRNQLSNAGGELYLISLMESVLTSAHIEYHSRIVLQKYIKRELIRYGSHLISDSYIPDADSLHLMERMEGNIKLIKEVAMRRSGSVHSSNDAKEELKNKMEAVLRGEVPGVYSGIREFDEWCGGFQKRELITIAARPGQGKTTFGVSMAWKAANDKKIPIAFFSLEMSSIDLKNRLASKITGVPYSEINQGKITTLQWSQVVEAYEIVDNSCLEIVDTRIHRNIHENIVDKMRELAGRGYKAFMIDYVQLMKLTLATSNDTSDLKKITRELKELAIELNVPIIEFAQLDRRVDDRPSKMPFLRDLKQSGSLEEDSDTVIFLVRKAYYELNEKPGLELPMSEIGKTEFVVAKGRNIGIRHFKIFLDFINYDALSYCDKYF